MLYPEEVNTPKSENKLEPHFQKKCAKLCKKFPDLLKPELESLKDFEVEVEFKDSAKPKFCKPRSLTSTICFTI